MNLYQLIHQYIPKLIPESIHMAQSTHKSSSHHEFADAADPDSATGVVPVSTPEAAGAGEALDAETLALEKSLVAMNLDQDTIQRIERLPRDIGWLLVTAGMVGIVMPGVLGLPFLVLGGLVIMPVTSRRAEHWLSGHSPSIFKGSVKQINRFLDDLERRYPRAKN